MRLATVAALVIAASLLAPEARAEPSAADRARAAAAFDDAVAKFGRAEFAAAARAFLDADAVIPNDDAIKNAIEAGSRASDFLTVARAAQRAIDRGAVLVQARQALANAATRLSRIELSCTPAPCALTIDGEPAAPPAAWALPGTHRVEGRSPAGAGASEQLSCVAGATYRVALSPTLPASGPGSGPTGPGSGSPPPDVHHGLPRAVFWSGLGVTAVLTGVTVWSGVDAIMAKKRLGSVSTTPLEDAVRADAHRTDGLLAGAGALAIATAVVGIWFTDWHPGGAPRPAAAVVPVPGGAALSAAVSF